MQIATKSNPLAKEKRRYFLATSAAAIAIIDDHLKARDTALAGIRAHLTDRLTDLSKLAKRDLAEITGGSQFRLNGGTIDGAASFGELVCFVVMGKFRRNILDGWANLESRSPTARVSFEPTKNNSAVAALTRVPGTPELAKAVNWNFYANANVIVAAPYALKLDKKRVLSVGAVAMFHPDAVLERRLQKWKAPAGFEEVTRARYELFVAQAAVKREESEKKAA